jgi:hypothetical protein
VHCFLFQFIADTFRLYEQVHVALASNKVANAKFLYAREGTIMLDCFTTLLNITVFRAEGLQSTSNEFVVNCRWESTR